MALALAQALLERPLMANHAHGLWGYVGTARDGAPLSVQSTGVGGPSAALVLRDLARLGVTRAIRVGLAREHQGTATSFSPGALLAVQRVRGEDGASRALGGAREPDPTLLSALTARADGVVDLVSRDLPGGEGLHDLETAALHAVGGVRLACGVVVAGGLDDDGLQAAQVRAGEAAAEALLP